MSKQDIHITEAELEILQVLWQHEGTTVKQVHEELTQDREARYTTTLKQMQVMFEKGLLSRDDSRRQHIYYPEVDRKKVQRKFMDKMMNTLFSGSASEMVLNALGSYKTSPEELDAIKKMIDKAKQTKKS